MPRDDHNAEKEMVSRRGRRQGKKCRQKEVNTTLSPFDRGRDLNQPERKKQKGRNPQPDRHRM